MTSNCLQCWVSFTIYFKEVFSFAFLELLTSFKLTFLALNPNDFTKMEVFSLRNYSPWEKPKSYRNQDFNRVSLIERSWVRIHLGAYLLIN